MTSPSAEAGSTALEPAGSALPSRWPEAWGKPSCFLAQRLRELRVAVEELATGVQLVDRSMTLQSLVGSLDLRTSPVHRWYYYKEGFSPRLPELIASELGTAQTGVVVDPFAGVGTTLLSLQRRAGVQAVVGIEYSPFAHFVGTAKLAATRHDIARLRCHAARLIRYTRDGRRIRIPELASFRNERIFERGTLYDLLAARDAIVLDRKLSTEERSFFLLGLAAIVEDMSGVMKDGRALRVRNGRRRRLNALTPACGGALSGSDVRSTLFNQWLAMIEDCAALAAAPGHSASVELHRGDARQLGEMARGGKSTFLSEQNVGLAVFSPPYLNCVDYTEVYKLELWMLGMVETHQQFRSLREGTLRSHPSITFPERPSSFDREAAVFEVVDSISRFLEERLTRAPVGRMVGHYFQDMYEVFKQIERVLAPGGSIACVVANSTFSRRTTSEDARQEEWRMPILTDVLLARLAEAAGLTGVELWSARDLRPRNVTAGTARESVMVARSAR